MPSNRENRYFIRLDVVSIGQIVLRVSAFYLLNWLSNRPDVLFFIFIQQEDTDTNSGNRTSNFWEIVEAILSMFFPIFPGDSNLKGILELLQRDADERWRHIPWIQKTFGSLANCRPAPSYEAHQEHWNWREMVPIFAIILQVKRHCVKWHQDGPACRKKWNQEGILTFSLRKPSLLPQPTQKVYLNDSFQEGLK